MGRHALTVSSSTLRTVVLILTAGGLASGALACGSARSEEGSPVIAADTHAAAVEAWRDQHEADYRRDYASIEGLHFLAPGSHTVGSAAANDLVLSADVPATIGRLVVEESAVRFEPAPGVKVSRTGQPVTGPIMLKEADAPPADEIVIAAVRLVVHLSGDRLSLRVRDPEGERATAFRGFSWFSIDSAYVVRGRFVADHEPRRLRVVNTFGDVDEYATEGVVEFELQGVRLRLRPFTTRPNRLYFVFRDASSGEETYETARFLYADLQEDGTTVLDFNQAYNPPCAFNPYTTCPIPLSENVLPVKVLAGERAYTTASASTRLHPFAFAR
jgi:hypothetical protein